jgi:hypothetical protein
VEGAAQVPSVAEEGVVDNGKRLGRKRQLDRRLDLVTARMDTLDERLAELGRRETVLRVMARDGLGQAERRLEVLEGAVAQADARTRDEARRLHALLAELADRILDATATPNRPD